MTNRKIAMVALVLGVAFVAGCDGVPRQQYVQWVARDAWDATCAEQAIVETWKAQNGNWKIPGEVWTVDVDATFKLVNKCESGLPLVGKSYKQFETVKFAQKLEMSKCKKGSETGWATPGKEGSRCWTGPTLLASP